MREIKSLVVHGSWTKPGVDVSVETIRKWHTDPKDEGGRGWSDIGYHFVIGRSGLWEIGRPVGRKGAHVAGHNDHTIGVCLVGGREDDTPDTAGLPEEVKQEVLWECNYTAAQFETLIERVAKLKVEFGFEDVRGHRDHDGVTKRCPGFDVRAFFS